MSEEPYLVLHKVRGLPAFDIAIRCDDMGTPLDPGPWWIIPTSGHRARPYQWWVMADIAYAPNAVEPWVEIDAIAFELNGKDWIDDWPDHYPCGHSLPEPSHISPALTSVLAALVKPAEPMKRRR